MGGWSCRYQIEDKCRKMNMITCSPGMPGCVLRGRYHFPMNEDKDRPGQKQKGQYSEARNEEQPATPYDKDM